MHFFYKLDVIKKTTNKQKKQNIRFLQNIFGEEVNLDNESNAR